jgi:hypothetical protein
MTLTINNAIFANNTSMACGAHMGLPGRDEQQRL